MPLYEYQCQSCGKTLEVLQKFSDEPLAVHEGCGGELEKLISRSAIQFKGSGWYVTDYAKNGSAPNGAQKGEAKEGGDSSSTEAKPSESKPADSQATTSKSSETTKSTETASKPAPAPASSNAK